MTRRRPTRDDVAALAGVSSAVVSYVVNDGPRPVSDATRRRVLDAVAELNYVPNGIARSLAGRSTRSIGFIAPTLANPAWAEVAAGIVDVVSDAGLLLTVCPVEDQPGRELRHAEVLVANRADGVVLVSTADTEQTLAVLADGGTPVVVVEQDVPSTSCVVFDAEATGRMVTDHLLDLGHRRIAMLREHRSRLDSWQRHLGYQNALRARGVEIVPSLIEEAPAGHGGDIVAAGIDAAAHLLDAEPRPTAVFAHNDLLAIAVVHEARRRGWHVPGDLSVAGADDLEGGRYLHPSLTTVATPKRRIGQVAADKLMALMAGGDQDGLTVLSPSGVIVRESTGPPPAPRG